MVAILKMSAKLVTLGLLKIMIFWIKGYDVIISVHDVTTRILPGNSNFIVDVVMWPNFGDCSPCMIEVITTSTYEDLTRKAKFLRASFGSSSIIWDWIKV